LKYHFRDFLQVAFLDAQDAENNFAWPLNSLKHAFIDIKFPFQDVQKADNEFSQPFAYLKHHFRDFIQTAICTPRM
jgi:hypothetical protein